MTSTYTPSARDISEVRGIAGTLEVILARPDIDPARREALEWCLADARDWLEEFDRG